MQAASSIALTVSGGTSDDSFNALKEAFLGGSRVLQSVKHLSVTDVRYRRFENTDVTYLFKAFPNLQVEQHCQYTSCSFHMHNGTLWDIEPCFG